MPCPSGDFLVTPRRPNQAQTGDTLTIGLTLTLNLGKSSRDWFIIKKVSWGSITYKVNLILARLSETITDSNHLTKRPFESAGMAFGIGLILSSSINE